MAQTIVEKAVEHLSESAQQASRATSAAAAAIEDGARVVRHAAKQGGEAAEGLLDDATQRVQRNPVLTVAATFAVGFGAGAVIGWMMKRK